MLFQRRQAAQEDQSRKYNYYVLPKEAKYIGSALFLRVGVAKTGYLYASGVVCSYADPRGDDATRTRNVFVLGLALYNGSHLMCGLIDITRQLSENVVAGLSKG
jgi:hypothetical protein